MFALSSTATPSSEPIASDRLIQLELLSLYAFAFVLPLFEAPKNLLWIIYSALWLTNRWRARYVGGPWDGWDILIVVWIASGYLSAQFSGLHNSEWLSAFDILRYGSILWFLRRSGYDEAALGKMLTALVAGTLAGLVRGYYEVRVTGEHQFLGLNSVGHVNHSAIYVAIVFGTAIAWLRAAWAPSEARIRVLGIVACGAFGLSLVIMQSRATVGIGFVIAILIIGTYSVRTGRSLLRVLLGVALLVALLFAAQPEVIRKNALRMHENLFLAHRDAIWRAGFIAWRQHPIFGVGMGNYGKIDYDRLQEWSRAQGEPFDQTRVLPQSHAHSLYMNTLTERGLSGLAILLAVLAAWAWTLVRNIPLRNDTVICWAYWGGAASAWVVTVAVGAVNTTLHHEHALVSMLLLGGWLSLRRQHPRLSEVRA